MFGPYILQNFYNHNIFFLNLIAKKTSNPHQPKFTGPLSLNTHLMVRIPISFLLSYTINVFRRPIIGHIVTAPIGAPAEELLMIVRSGIGI